VLAARRFTCELTPIRGLRRCDEDQVVIGLIERSDASSQLLFDFRHGVRTGTPYWLFPLRL
jgi:hypothetical protein